MAVEVHDLVKGFRVHRREAGLRASLRGVVRRDDVDVRAVDGVSFGVAAGEVVGFLGPNGAGKTTTLKCLSGLLHPTSDHVRVLGHEPFRRDAEFLSRISLVMGQRNSLFWDLPALDAFEVHRTVHRVPAARYRRGDRPAAGPASRGRRRDRRPTGRGRDPSGVRRWLTSRSIRRRRRRRDGPGPVAPPDLPEPAVGSFAPRSRSP